MHFIFYTNVGIVDSVGLSEQDAWERYLQANQIVCPFAVREHLCRIGELQSARSSEQYYKAVCG